MIVGVGGVLAAASNLEIVAGLGLVSRIVGGLRIISFKEALVGGALGLSAGKFVAPAICSGLALAYDKVLSAPSQGSSSGNVSQPSVSPSDFKPEKPDGGNGQQGPQVQGPGSTAGPGPAQGPSQAPTGTVGEGDGFNAVQVNGPTSVTITAQDGSSAQISTDKDGNTTVVNYDSDGHVTSIDAYDKQGNHDDSLIEVEQEGTVPDGNGGYPVPDGNDGPGGPAGHTAEYPTPDGGPGGPAGFTASLVAYPKPDDLGTGSSHPTVGPAALVGMGATYLVGGLSGFRTFGSGVF
jgi:YD repeat-containing protein